MTRIFDGNGKLVQTKLKPNKLELIEYPDRLVIRPIKANWFFNILFSFLILIILSFIVLYLYHVTVLFKFNIPAMIFSNAISSVFFLLLSVFLPGCCFFQSFHGPYSKLSIYVDGWVRKGFMSWRFPGAMRVRYFLQRSTKYPKTEFEFTYGTSNLYASFDSIRTEMKEFADQITQWTRSRMIGIPDSSTARGDNFMRNWGLFYSAISIITLFCDVYTVSLDYHLNEYITPGHWAISVTTWAVVVCLAVAGWHWTRLAQREIQAGKVVWAMDVLMVLLLIASVSAVAMRFGQIQDMCTSPAIEVTMRQPVHYSAGSGRQCHNNLWIMEPQLGRSIQYCDDGNGHSAPYWNNAAAMEIHQTQNEFGVHILSVDRIPLPPSHAEATTKHS